ncbi:MAG: hypothetical protein MJZ49_01245 [Bacteroidales bacterium]|nr:hypothetical protein [Bacteroidales bacterium]
MDWFWLMVWVKIFVVNETDRDDCGSNISADVEPQPPGNNNHCQGQKNASISMGDVAFFVEVDKRLFNSDFIHKRIFHWRSVNKNKDRGSFVRWKGEKNEKK